MSVLFSKRLVFSPGMKIDNLGSQLAQKANIAQEAWITPTLLNSWAQQNSINYPVRYMKDSMGFVHLKGVLNSGTYNTIAFNLPVGYRPAKDTFVVSRDSSSAKPGVVNANGDFYPTSATFSSWIAIDSVSFRAEA